MSYRVSRQIAGSLPGLSLIAMLSLVAAEVSAQPPGRGGFGGPGGGRLNPFGVAGLLMSEQVQGEIELLDDQKAELEAMRDELRDEMRDRFRDMFSGMRDMSREEREERMVEVREEMEEIRENIESRVKGVLMPHQFDRLRQIELQQQMQRGGGAALTGGRLAEALDLTDAQKKEMQRKAAEAQAELEKKIQQLRLEARESVLEVLTSDQRAKFDELVGKPFEMEQPAFGRGGDRFRRGGDRGRSRGERPELE